MYNFLLVKNIFCQSVCQSESFLIFNTLTGFKLSLQQRATIFNRVCRRTQHITSNNVVSACTGLKLFSLPLKQSVCESSNVDLCGDKGICLPDYSKDSFTCKCDKGYTGTRCGKLQTSHPLGLFHLGGLKTKDSNHLCIKCDLKLFIYLLASYYSEVVFTRFYIKSKVRERKAFSWSKECSAIGHGRI